MNGKVLVGLLLIAVGVILGLYCGLWWAFIGGIITIIEQVRAEHLEAALVAIGICKVLFAGVIGWAAAAVCIIPGMVMLKLK